MNSFKSREMVALFMRNEKVEIVISVIKRHDFFLRDLSNLPLIRVVVIFFVPVFRISLKTYKFFMQDLMRS